MKTNAREILVLHNPGEEGTKVIAHARSIVPHVRSYTFRGLDSSNSVWGGIINALDMHPKDMLNKSDPYYQEFIKGKEFDLDCWINILKKSPELIRAPIAIRGHKAVMCFNSSDVHKLSGVLA